MPRTSKDTSCPAMTSAATTASCVALWASMGSPTTSPIAKMRGTFVRSCSSTAMKPRSQTDTHSLLGPFLTRLRWTADEPTVGDGRARLVGVDRAAVGTATDGDEDAVEHLVADV